MRKKELFICPREHSKELLNLGYETDNAFIYRRIARQMIDKVCIIFIDRGCSCCQCWQLTRIVRRPRSVHTFTYKRLLVQSLASHFHRYNNLYLQEQDKGTKEQRTDQSTDLHEQSLPAGRSN